MAGNITVTTAANFIPEIWADELSDAVQANVVLSELVDRQYEDDMKFGDVIHITDASNPAVSTKAADTAVTFANITETMQNVTINLHAYVAFRVEDIVELQSKYEARSTYTNKTGYSLTAYVEGDLTNGLASLPDNFSQSVGTLGVDPTYDDLVEAAKLLDDADAPDDGRFFYVSPATHAAMLKMTEFTSSDYVAGRAVQTAKVGQVLGTRVYKSTLANNNPAAAGQSYSWFCHKRGVALIMQRKPMIHTDYILEEIAWGVVSDCIYNFAERLIAPKDLGGGTSVDTFNVSVAGA